MQHCADLTDAEARGQAACASRWVAARVHATPVSLVGDSA